MTLEEYLAVDRSKMEKDDRREILDALAWMVRLHRGQMRQSGEPYHTHPLEVAHLMEKVIEEGRLDTTLILVALLHDIMEECDVFFEQINGAFGWDVAWLVDCLSKKESQTDEGYFQQIREGIKDDWRVLFLKLADNIHNLETLSFLILEKQLAFVKESREAYLPMARQFKPQVPQRYHALLDDWLRKIEELVARPFAPPRPCLVLLEGETPTIIL